MPWYPHNHDDRYVRQASQRWNNIIDSIEGMISAYDVAVAEGYTGTRAQWLASLKGDKGDPGAGTTEAENDADIAGGFVLADGKATWLTTKQDGGPTAYAISKLNDAGVGGGGAVSSVNGQTGAVVLDAADVGALPDDTVIPSGGDVNLLQAVDVFGEAITAADIDTYAELIAAVDAALSGAGATKTNIGTAGDGATTIWAYTYGPTTVPHVLLTCAIHGDEEMAAHAGLRFFTAFVTSTNPVMAALRERVRITYIPALNAANYGISRYGPAGTNRDLNRNWAYNWGVHSQSSGVAAFSEPETAAVKALVDANPIGLLIDCHMKTGSDRPTTLSYFPSNSGTAGNRRVIVGAASLWSQLYDTTPVGIDLFEDDPKMGRPNTVNWGGRYLRYGLGRANGTSVLIEGGRTMAGSANNTTTTAEALRLYCGYIHMVIASWLLYGQTPEPIVPRTWMIRRTVTTEDATGIASGGSLINTTTATALGFDDTPADTPGFERTTVYFPLPAPGYFVINAMATLEGNSGAAAYKTVEMRLAWGEVGGTLAEIADTTHYAFASVPPGGGRTTLTSTWKVDGGDVTDDPHRVAFQLKLRVLDSTSDPVIAKSARVMVTFFPHEATDFLPIAMQS